jgi:drug/metabolite transporter (DMT)-like permease
MAARKTDRPGNASGYGAGILAGLVWGLAFLVPLLLRDWNAVTVTAGRYLAYGAASLAALGYGARGLLAVASRHWRAALMFAVAGNVGYYLLLVLGIELAGAPVTDIVIGVIPVTMAVAGNVVTPAYRWRALLPPITLVVAGMVVVDVVGLSSGTSAPSVTATTRMLGILAGFGAVALWTWYGLANATFLTRNPEVTATGWSTVTGLATGLVTLAALPLAVVTHQLGRSGRSGTGSVDHGRPGIAALLFGCVVLGVLVSWAATGLWNVASARLPPTAAGTLVNVETLAGYGYVYLALGAWPPVGQVVGLALILAGVLLVVRLRAQSARTTGCHTVEPWCDWSSTASSA